MTRVLFVKGCDDDYAASCAQNAFDHSKFGWTLEKALNNSQEFRKFLDEDCGLSEETTVEVVEYGEMDLAFAKYVRDYMMDYDSIEQSSFWVEGENG